MKKEVPPLIETLAKKELLKSFKMAVVHHFKTGEVILKEGQVSDCCFYLVKGRVRISKRMKRNIQVKVGNLGAGQFFGEMAMLSGHRRSATVTALSPVEAIEIKQSEFEKLAQSNNALAGTLALHFSIQMANRINRLLKLLAKHGDPISVSETTEKAIDVRQVLHKVYSFWAV